MKYVYVAGPMGDPHTARDRIHRGIEVGERLLRAGFAPFVPHLWHYAERLHSCDISYEQFLEYDFSWIERCDALLRLSGHSPGADREVNHALENGILVYEGNLDDFITFMGGRE